MLGALDMFAIGIGPSSSHTIGPMKAALEFVKLLHATNQLDKVTRVQVDLFGSLALTGEGHGTLLAVINGLSGQHPKTINPDSFLTRANLAITRNELNLLQNHLVKFDFLNDILLHKTVFLPEHSNAIRFSAFAKNKELIVIKTYYSIGGGFILDDLQITKQSQVNISSELQPTYPFKTANELYEMCQRNKLSIAQLVLENELVRTTEEQVKLDALEIAEVMHQSVIKGCNTSGILPGILKVKRRAKDLFDKLASNSTDQAPTSTTNQRLLAITYAMAVNEENAAFSRIVTAPTNGSAGTIPGVLEYYRNFYSDVNDAKLIEFILTAGAIGTLYKFGASISAAEVGCQGEIGVACSMAAGALTAVLGGSVAQVMVAAEIAMEHSLGMTCDPIAGLVQIPCIERNGVAASRAIDITKLVLLENKPGLVSLDDIIKTMLQTGRDMSRSYKETSLGGLAVNVVFC